MASGAARGRSFYWSRFWSALDTIRAGADPWQERVLLLVTFLITTALVLSRFEQSFWSDEASSLWFARLPLTTLLTKLCDPHPPGYYLLLKAWLAGGQNEFWLRWPSLLAALLAVALTYRLGRESYGRRWAWLAALLLTLHPLQTWYAGEARMYILAQNLGLLLVWSGWRLLQAPRWGNAAIYGLVALVGLGIDYVTLLPIGLFQLLWLARDYPHARRWLSLQAVVLVIVALWWLKPSQLLALDHGYQTVFVAVRANRLGIALTPAGAARLLQLAIAGLALIGPALAWYWPRHPGHRLDQPGMRLLLTGGWLALLALAVLPQAFTVKRQLIVFLPYLALLTSRTLTRLSWPAVGLVAGLGLLATVWVLPNHPREPWRAVVADLMREAPGSAGVIWVDELSVPAFDYYWRNGEAETTPARWTPLYGRRLPQLPDLVPQPGQTLLIVTAESLYRHLTALLPADFYHHYRLLEARHEVGIGLYRYQRQANPVPGQPGIPAPDRLVEWGALLPSPLDTCQPK